MLSETIKDLRQKVCEVEYVELKSFNDTLEEHPIIIPEEEEESLTVERSEPEAADPFGNVVVPMGDDSNVSDSENRNMTYYLVTMRESRWGVFQCVFFAIICGLLILWLLSYFVPTFHKLFSTPSKN